MTVTTFAGVGRVPLLQERGATVNGGERVVICEAKKAVCPFAAIAFVFTLPLGHSLRPRAVSGCWVAAASVCGRATLHQVFHIDGLFHIRAGRQTIGI